MSVEYREKNYMLKFKRLDLNAISAIEFGQCITSLGLFSSFDKEQDSLSYGVAVKIK